MLHCSYWTPKQGKFPFLHILNPLEISDNSFDNQKKQRTKIVNQTILCWFLESSLLSNIIKVFVHVI